MFPPTPPQNSRAELSSFTILHMRSRLQNQKMEGLQARAGGPWRMRGQQMSTTSLGSGRRITSPGLSQVMLKAEPLQGLLPPVLQFSLTCERLTSANSFPEKIPLLGSRKGFQSRSRSLVLWDLGSLWSLQGQPNRVIVD